MLTKKVRLRIFYLILSLLFVTSIIFLVLKSLEDNVVYFFSPTEIYNKTDISISGKIRIGGLVKKGSVINNESDVVFIITDLKKNIEVSYEGILPDLFREGQGVIVNGYLKNNIFEASEVLAKHDENYMPPEIKKMLEN